MLLPLIIFEKSNILGDVWPMFSSVFLYIPFHNGTRNHTQKYLIKANINDTHFDR